MAGRPSGLHDTCKAWAHGRQDRGAASPPRPNYAISARRRPTSPDQTRRMVAMSEPKLEVPAELRDLAEKTIDQAERAFGMFFDAANKSVASISTPGSEISKQALAFTEQN